MNMDKASLRILFREKRQNITGDQAIKAAQCAASFIFERISKADWRKIAIYSAFDGEISAWPLCLKLWQEGSDVYFPRIGDGESEGISFYRVREMAELTPGHFGILEPSADAQALEEVDQLDLVVVPGVAFDRRGYRVGLGNGYYDRFLSRFNGVKIGLAYEFQVLDRVVEDPWDIRMDGIATETGIL